VIPVVGGVILILVILAILNARSLIYNCAPNEVLIISGSRRRVNGKEVGYRLIKGGTGIRWPLFERIDRMDLTNMVIDVSATNAYCKGGIPLNVQGVANVKIAGHEPILNNAIERFLGRSRVEIMQIAKATLEGSLRGVLSTMTPEQINEDKILFAEKLVHEVEADMTALGLVVDTMKIQNVHDDVKYLDSIGRKRSAEVVSTARVAEAVARADAVVVEAENREKEVATQIAGQIAFAKADAERRRMDAITRREAVIAEERSAVTALVAQARAELDVYRARLEPVRRKLEADVIQPAVAEAKAAESLAKAKVAGTIADAVAKAEALKAIADSWDKAGPNARQIMILQKLQPIIEALAATVADTNVDKVTMIDARLGEGGNSPAKALPVLEQVKELYGIDLVQKIKDFGTNKPATIHEQPRPSGELPEGS
jgi:flotillin